MNNKDYFAIHNALIKRVIQDTRWLLPDWFNSHLASYDASLIEKYTSLNFEINGIVPYDAVIWGAHVTNNKDLYPRTLGFTADLTFRYLNPLGVFFAQCDTNNPKAGEMMFKFEQDMLANVGVLAVAKTDFSEFSFEILKEGFITSQERMFEMGEEIYETYLNGTSFMLKPVTGIEFYSNVVNLVVFSWLMTTNHQCLSYGSKLLANQPKHRLHFYTPLLNKGKELWALRSRKSKR